MDGSMDGRSKANRKTAARKAMEAKTKINKDVKVGKIKPVEKVEVTYPCSACGKVYKKQYGNFNSTYSPLYAGNNGYVTVCNNCKEKYFETLVDFFSGNEVKALERICEIFDWYFSEAGVESSNKSTTKSLVGMYPSKIGLIRKNGETYLDTIRDRASEAIETEEDLKKLKQEGKISVTNVSVERWGLGGFTETDYKILDDHYKMLKRQNPNCDNNQEIFIKDLCYIKLQQLNSMRDNKPAAFDKFTKLYRETFKAAGLKTIQDVDTSSEETLGVTLQVISQYTPEEYYKDKKLYEDHDNIGEYMKRFVLRPLKNLMTGTRERDSVYSVSENEEIDSVDLDE